MKKITFSILGYLLFANILFSQESQPEFKPTGKVLGTVFWNYNYNLTKDVRQTSTFYLERSYFGYEYAFSEKLSTKLQFDVGKDDGSAFTAYLKTAQLDWSFTKSLKLSLGMIGSKHFDTQEKTWGYRYIMKTVADEFGLGTSADLGANLEIKAHKMLLFNLFITNGEGYKSLQDKYGMHRLGGNVIITPVEGLIVKAHYDNMPGKYDKFGNDSIIADTCAISNMSFSAGYQFKEKFRLGVEYNILDNGKKYNSPAEGYQLTGISLYGTYIFSKKFELLFRYDKLSSNKPEGKTENWNNAKDGSMILAGLQYNIAKGIKTSLNYRMWDFAKEGTDNNSLIFLNFEYKF